MNPLKSAQSALESLRKPRVELNRKIDAIEQSVRILLPVYADPLRNTSELPFDAERVGITDAIEGVLISHPDQELSPTQVRDLLLEADFEVAGGMSSVHQILKRLVKRRGPIRPVDTGAGTLYKYDSKIPPKLGSLSRR
jgi:hypothetical protein